MNKRRILLLAGLMATGMVSFAGAGDAAFHNDEVKDQNSFSINDRYRYDENRLEINGNINLDENNRIELRARAFTNVGSDVNKSRPSGYETEDGSEIRLRLHTQTPVEDMVVRTEFTASSYDGGDTQQLLRVQPTFYFFTDVEGLESLVRVGFGMEHSGNAHGQDWMVTTSYENYYILNDYISLEGNIYYDWTFAGDGRRSTNIEGGKKHGSSKYNNFDIEAYAFFNYPLYESNGYKLSALFEGGLDPYTFGNRFFGKLNDVDANTTNHANNTMTVYVQPSVKLSKSINDENDLYLELGYYNMKNERNGAGGYDDTGFARIGYSNRF